MKLLKHLPYLLAGFAFLGLSNQAVASPIGTANITNCTPGGGFTFSATTINWLPPAGSGLGCIATGLPTSIAYSGGTFTSGTGTIEDLAGGAPGTFMLLAGGVLDYSLSAFAAPATTDGICSTTVALATGHSCIAFAGSPFLFTSQGATTAVSLDALGILTDTGNASTSPYSGLFTTQLIANTAAIASTIDAGGSITSTYSATLATGPAGSASTPEPATFALLSTGVALLGIGRKRFGKG